MSNVRRLPFLPRFEGAKSRILAQHDRVERELIVQFVGAQRCGETERMRHLAGVLAQFRGYSQCVDAFIEEMQCVSAGRE